MKFQAIWLKSIYKVSRLRLSGVHIKYGTQFFGDVKIGKYTRINLKSHLQNCEIGSCCAIAGRLIIRDSNHHTNFLNMQSFFQHKVIDSRVSVVGKSKGKVKIGNGVWIGDSVIILSGVSVGNGAVIGAGSVVTKSVPEFAVVAGNPAKIIKYRFSDRICEILKGIQWWDWSLSKLKDNKALFELNLDEITVGELNKVVKGLTVNKR